MKANLVGTNFAKQCQEHVVSSQYRHTPKRETCKMQRRTSKAGVVTATCLLILVSISPVFADIGVRAAPRPSSDPSDTAEKASSLREAQPSATQTGL